MGYICCRSYIIDKLGEKGINKIYKLAEIYHSENIEKVSDEFIENQFYDFYIVKNDEINIEEIQIQESELQDIKFVDLNTLKKMIDENIIVDRKPIYDELVKYLK